MTQPTPITPAPLPCGSCGARNPPLPDGGLPCGH